MPELLSSKKVVARKAHPCMTCSVTAIQPGDEYHRQAYVYDGRAYTWVTCTDCQALVHDVWDWANRPWDEGIGPDAYLGWAEDHQDHPDCGDAARAYLARITPKETDR